jgi:hypothetical protein
MRVGKVRKMGSAQTDVEERKIRQIFSVYQQTFLDRFAASWATAIG